MRGFLAFAILCAFIGSAQAHSRRHVYVAPDMVHGLAYGFWHMKQSGDRNLAHHHKARRRPHYRHSDMPQRTYATWGEPYFMTAIGNGVRRAVRSMDPRPSAWCGWEMRRLVSSDPGQAYNLARNWAHWGRPGAAGIGAVVVWPHHVGRIVGQQNGKWVIESGNDGHALRTRPRSIAGAIAIRWEA